MTIAVALLTYLQKRWPDATEQDAQSILDVTSNALREAGYIIRKRKMTQKERAQVVLPAANAARLRRQRERVDTAMVIISRLREQNPAITRAEIADALTKAQVSPARGTEWTARAITYVTKVAKRLGSETP